MNKQQYQEARRMVRDNGTFALRWMRMAHASIMMQLLFARADKLQEKVDYANRRG